MPVHGNPANRHARTTRVSHSRWAIAGTHPANRREFGDPYCSVLFCSVHTLDCHTGTAQQIATRGRHCSVLFTHWTATQGQPNKSPHEDDTVFKKIHAEPPHTDGPNLKQFIQIPLPKFTIQFLSIQFHASIVPIMQFYTISNECSTFTTCSLSTRLKKELLTSIPAFLYYL